MKKSAARVVREYAPFPEGTKVGGVSFDGKNVWAACGDRLNAIDPATGKLQRSLDVQAHAGTAFDGRHLYQIAESQIQKVDPGTGKVLRTIESNRFVTGVTWLGNELWHATWEGDESELRRVDPKSGEVLETLELPAGVNVSGLESNGKDTFFCGGAGTGKVRAVTRGAKTP